VVIALGHISEPVLVYGYSTRMVKVAGFRAFTAYRFYYFTIGCKIDNVILKCIEYDYVTIAIHRDGLGLEKVPGLLQGRPHAFKFVDFLG